MIQTKKRKNFKDLNLLDRFLFAEPQKTNTNNFPKRSRLYQGLIDSNLLPPGSVNFNVLNTVVIILITPFDIFGHELYKYTFHMKCEEIPELQLNDEATRIFLNTHGKHPELVSPELIELLKYMEKSTEETVEHCNSKKVQELHQKICQLKANKQMEAKFMQAWEEKVLERQEAYAEGEKVGEDRGSQKMAALCGKLLEMNRQEDMQLAIADETYRKKLFKELDL